MNVMPYLASTMEHVWTSCLVMSVNVHLGGLVQTVRAGMMSVPLTSVRIKEIAIVSTIPTSAGQYLSLNLKSDSRLAIISVHLTSVRIKGIAIVSTIPSSAGQ